jgi:hypothetical protein
VLEHVDGVFHPHILAMQAGQPLSLISRTVCGLIAAPPARGMNRPFVMSPPMGKVLTRRFFEHPELGISIKCDVHPWSYAYVSVFAHPFFAVTDQDGKFTIPNVPPGEYTIHAVHRRTHPFFKGLTMPVAVGREDMEVNFVVQLD